MVDDFQSDDFQEDDFQEDTAPPTPGYLDPRVLGLVPTAAKVITQDIRRDYVQPAAELAGMVLAPGGIIPKALGYAAGGQLSKFGRRAAGDIPGPSSVKEGLIEAGKDVGEGALMEASGKVLQKGFQAGKQALRPAGRYAAKIFQSSSGVPERYFRRLAGDPGSLFTADSIDTAGSKLGRVASQQKINLDPTVSETIDPQLSTARRISKNTLLAMKKGFAVPVNRLIKARRAVDRIMAATSYKDKAGRQSLFQAREFINDRIGELNGPFQEASKNYARSALAGQFRQVLPVTESGKISKLGSFLFPTLIGQGDSLGRQGASAAIAALTAQSPLVAGLLTSSGAAAGKVAQSAINNPLLRRLAIMRMRDTFRGGNTDE